MPSGDKVSLNFPRNTAPLTSMSFPQPPIPVVTRQDSYTTISRLVRAASIEHRSPGTPSPVGAAQLRSIVQRLEDIDAESRLLLKKLFSMLEKDEKLEHYVRRRLEDPKVSRMWELVEQVLDSHRGEEESLDLEKMLGSESSGSSSDGGLNDAAGGISSDSGSGSGPYGVGGCGELYRLHKLTTEKGLRMSDQDMTIETNVMGIGDRDDLKLRRFKIRTLDSAGIDSGEVQPPPNDQTKDKGGSG